MTEKRIQEIAEKVYRKHDKITSALLRVVPEVNTKDACNLLDCNRRWLYENKHLFNYRFKNKRRDLVFETHSLITYKRMMSS